MLLATIYVLLYHYFKIDLSDGSSSFMQGVIDGGTKEANKNNIISYYGKIEKWANTHYSEQALMQIPFFALGTFIFFRKSGYNYVQFFVLITFITALGLLVRTYYSRFYLCLKITNIIYCLYRNWLHSFFRFGRTFSFSIHTLNSKFLVLFYYPICLLSRRGVF